MDRETVRECPMSHAVDGPCRNNVATYQMADLRRDGRANGCGSRCSRCNEWIAPPGVAATHDRYGEPIVAALAPLTASEREAQADRCRCGGSDTECPCQHTPDAETVRARIAASAAAMARHHTETMDGFGRWMAGHGYAAVPHVRSARR